MMPKKMDAELAGASILVATSMPNFYSGLLPSKMTISRFAHSDFDRMRLRQGIAVATAMGVAEAVAIGFMFDSLVPVIAGFAVIGVLIWQYEDAIQNPHPENMPIDSPNNQNG
jgi:hypothetical protein